MKILRLHDEKHHQISLLEGHMYKYYHYVLFDYPMLNCIYQSD